MNTKQLPSMVDESKAVAAPLAQLTPMEMLNAAINRGADMDVLTKLMDLQERWERTQARKAFDDAIAAAKAEIKPIPKNRMGHGDRKYADMAAIAEAVDPIITSHGLSYRYRTVQTDRITVTCVLSHRAGHYEETTLSGPADQSGAKNAIQAIGSTLTYLQRYSIMQALGLAVTDDDDGETSTATVKNGWPQGSLNQPGDYEGGISERAIKKRNGLPPTGNARAVAAWWTNRLRNAETIADYWAISTEASAKDSTYMRLPQALFDEVNKESETAYNRLRGRGEEIPGQVVWDTDNEDPRPATTEDLVEANERASSSAVSPPAAGGQPDSPHQPGAARVPYAYAQKVRP